jgi:hypothetical protein
MTRVVVVAEGQTEETFVRQILAPYLATRSVYLTARLVGRVGHKGGLTTYAKLRNDILLLLRQDPAWYCTTFIDYYGRPRDFPAFPSFTRATDRASASRIALFDDIVGHEPDADRRFIPYVQMHEFEALLFADPIVLADKLWVPEKAAAFQAVRDQFVTPEDINDGASTAPSKRLLALGSYQKPIGGVLAAEAMGLEAIRAHCPIFDCWLRTLESL